MAFNLHSVAISPANFGVLIFHMWKNKIPEGIQILPAGVGAAAPKATPAAEALPLDETLKNVRLGFDSVLERCSISQVVVSEGQNGYCRVYVNFESWELWKKNNPGREMEECWYKEGNAYKPFLRSLFNEAYATAKIRREGEKVSVRFSDKRANGFEVKIMFTGEKPAPVLAKIVWPADTVADAKATISARSTLHLPKS